ncbi:hypothetical protein BDZ45DRAFT_803739 [Acephala macrosclerotiorum]|nr:hypothetical protein BDZ45DRAFT_803739 [Acephala macrosclerotiorum]
MQPWSQPGMQSSAWAQGGTTRSCDKSKYRHRNVEKRNHTGIFDGRHAEAIPKRVIDDIENEFRGRRKKTKLVSPVKERGGRCHPLPDHDHILPSMATVITYNAQNIRQHPKTHLNDLDAFPCDVDKCDKKFQTQHNLKQHKEKCRNPNIKLYTCHKCTPPRPFKTKGSLDRHDDKVHVNPGKVEVECPDCHKKLAKETLTVHRRENCKYRKEDLIYKCPECGKSLSYRKIGKHMEIEHKRADGVIGFADQAGMVDKGAEDAPIFAKKVVAVRNMDVEMGDEGRDMDVEMGEMHGDARNGDRSLWYRKH